MRKEISQDSRELFRLIAENVNDFAVFVTDLGGRVLSWNPGVGSLLGRALPADRGGKTPAAALTAYARADDRLRTLRAGFQHHVTKPAEPQELLAVVANLAGRST